MSSTPSCSTALTSVVTTPDETEDTVNTILLEQQKSWEDVTADVVTADIQTDLTDTLDLPIPLDQQMFCDIQKLASKSSQLIGNLHILVQLHIYHAVTIFTGNFTTNLAEGYMHI